jgi:hypothetical protein
MFISPQNIVQTLLRDKLALETLGYR